MAYSNDELERMLTDLEPDLVERKSTFKGDVPKEAREAICSFANDLPDRRRPGVVFVGARDDGEPSRLTVTDALLRQLADIKTDGNIVPPPTMSVARHVLRGAEMAVIVVWPADSPPVRFKGRIHVRTGSRRGIATAQDERILNEKRRHHDRPYDVRAVPSATLDDFDLLWFESEYLPAAVAPDVLEANDRTDQERLAAAKMIVSIEQAVPTVLGLLVGGTSTRSFLAGAYVQFVRVQGTEIDQPITDESLIDGTVGDVIRRLEEKLAAHNWSGVDFTSGPVEQRRSLYPMAALQQLARNAILHRTYEGTNAPVRITWYNDRIEMLSPGGPYGEVTPENFGNPGITDYRNPNLAEAMRVLGFVQRFGAGLTVARNALQQNGNPPPEFRVDSSHVLVTVRRAS